MKEGIPGRRKFLGILGGGIAASAASKAEAKRVSPEEMDPPPRRIESSQVPEQQWGNDYYEYTPPQAEEPLPEVKRINEWLEMEENIGYMLETDPEHFSIDTETGAVHISSHRGDGEGASAPFDFTFAPEVTQMLRVRLSSEGNRIDFTYLMKEGSRQRISVRRLFNGDIEIAADKATPISDFPGRSEKL